MNWIILLLAGLFEVSLTFVWGRLGPHPVLSSIFGAEVFLSPQY